MRGWSFAIITIILSSIILLLLKDLLANFIITCTLKDRRIAWLCLVEGHLASPYDQVSIKVEHTKCSRMTSMTQENPIGRPRLKLIKPTLLENEALTTKSPEMAHSRCSPVHELIARLVQEGPQKNLVPNMASSTHHLRPISSRSRMLIKHHPSHLTNGTILPLNHTILTSHIGRRKLMFETQLMTKGFEMRVFKFTTIVATNSSNSISMSLVLQPQD
jgi:hypothetical protein